MTQATSRQVNYLLILFNDCGFTGEQMRAYLSEYYNVRGCGDLTSMQASELIEELKETKERL